MTRPAALFVFVALGVPAAAGDPLPVAPPPRKVQPDGSREPAPGAAPAEDPAAVVERIIAGARKASDKLAAADAGADTRATQSGVLKDIDILLNPPDSPPKGGGESNDMNKQDQNNGKDNKGNDKSNQKPNDGMGSGQKDQKGDGQKGKGGTDQKGGTEPKGGMNPGGMEPKGGMNPGGMGPPKDGMNPGGTGQKEGQASGRRPRAGAPKDGKDPGGMAQGGKKSDPQPMNPGQVAKAGTPKDPAGIGGGAADKKNDRPPPPIQPQLPLADVVAKEVWGHLPERLRLQMTQHYREEFMPRYAGLLRQYYSSLSSGPSGPPAAPR